MIILDTNIISEMMKPQPNPAVKAWLNQQNLDTLYISTITQAELLFGIAALPDGRKKQALSQMLAEIIPLFEGRILAFDSMAAQHYAQLAIKARRDGYIAAIAMSKKFIVASRDVAPFSAVALEVINPFI